MLNRTIDRLEAKLAPHAKAVSVVAVVWFWAGVAIQARFVPLPDLPRAVEAAIFWAGVALNALWWAWLRPAIEQRRRAREQTPRPALAPPE